MATTRATVGFQPRWSPLETPPGPPCVARFPRMIPAIPKSAVWASETIPPYEDRKIRLDAAIPKSPRGLNESTSAISTKVRIVEYCVQQSEPVVGRYVAAKLATNA